MFFFPHLIDNDDFLPPLLWQVDQARSYLTPSACFVLFCVLHMYFFSEGNEEPEKDVLFSPSYRQ